MTCLLSTSSTGIVSRLRNRASRYNLENSVHENSRVVSCTVRSADPVHTTLAVGCQSTHVTAAAWPGNARTTPPGPSASRSTSAASSDEDACANPRPSGSNATVLLVFVFVSDASSPDRLAIRRFGDSAPRRPFAFHVHGVNHRSQSMKTPLGDDAVRPRAEHGVLIGAEREARRRLAPRMRRPRHDLFPRVEVEQTHRSVRARGGEHLPVMIERHLVHGSGVRPERKRRRRRENLRVPNFERAANAGRPAARPRIARRRARAKTWSLGEHRRSSQCGNASSPAASHTARACSRFHARTDPRPAATSRSASLPLRNHSNDRISAPQSIVASEKAPRTAPRTTLVVSARGDHTRTVPSAPPLATASPSGLYLARVTAPECHASDSRRTNEHSAGDATGETNERTRSVSSVSSEGSARRASSTVSAATSAEPRGFGSGRSTETDSVAPSTGSVAPSTGSVAPSRRRSRRLASRPRYAAASLARSASSLSLARRAARSLSVSRSKAAIFAASSSRLRLAAANRRMAGLGAAAIVSERKLRALTTTASVHDGAKNGANRGSDVGRLA